MLASDYSRLGEEIRTIDEAGTPYIHVDIMDGNFVPSINFGMPVVRAFRKMTDKVLDVHLMVEEPDRYVAEFADCGADIITVHAEACTHLHRTLQHIRSIGKKAGVALNPATPLSCSGLCPRRGGYDSPHVRKPGLRRAALHSGGDGKNAVIFGKN